MTVVQAPPTGSRDEVVAIGGADRLGPAEWNGLARRGFHLHQWFTGAERCGWNPRHVVVQGGARIKAIVPAYLIRSGTLHDLHHRWLGPLRDVAALAGLQLRPLLSVQAPFAQVSEALGDLSGLSSGILHEVFYALEQTAEQEGAKAVAWPFVEAGSDHLIEVARERGYAVLYSGSTAQLRMQWSSFEEYVSTRSKNVRRTIRADLAEIRSAGLRTMLVSDFQYEAAAMDRLYREAFRLRNGREAPLSSDLFQQLGRRPTPSIRAHHTWRGDRLVGSSLNLSTPELLDGTFAAFAPEHRGGPVYFNDLCYEPIRMAAREGIAAIDLGASALYAKALRGATLRRRVILIRGTTPGRHLLLRALGHLVARRTEQKERRALEPLGGVDRFMEGDGAR
jgi:predicted N-acyltransferase